MSANAPIPMIAPSAMVALHIGLRAATQTLSTTTIKTKITTG